MINCFIVCHPVVSIFNVCYVEWYQYYSTQFYPQLYLSCSARLEQAFETLAKLKLLIYFIVSSCSNVPSTLRLLIPTPTINFIYGTLQSVFD